MLTVQCCQETLASGDSIHTLCGASRDEFRAAFLKWHPHSLMCSLLNHDTWGQWDSIPQRRGHFRETFGRIPLDFSIYTPLLACMQLSCKSDKKSVNLG